MAYNSLGAINSRKGELAQAEAEYHKALKINEALDSKVGIGVAYWHLGTLYATRGDLDQARITCARRWKPPRLRASSSWWP